MRKNPYFFIMALVALISLTACGGGDQAEEALPRTAAEVERAFQAAPEIFGPNSGSAPGIEWSRDTDRTIDHLVVRYQGHVLYDEEHWYAYANRGQMNDGTDIVLVQEYDRLEDSGRTTLFVGGVQPPLPVLYIDRDGPTPRRASIRNVHEYPGGWLIIVASHGLLTDEEPPIRFAWIMYHPATGQVRDYGEHCGPCLIR